MAKFWCYLDLGVEVEGVDFDDINVRAQAKGAFTAALYTEKYDLTIVSGDPERLPYIPQRPQRQDDLTQQLVDLRNFARRLGMYDADDYLGAKMRERNAWLTG